MIFHLYNEAHLKEIEDFVKAASASDLDERFCFSSKEFPQFALQVRADHIYKVTAFLLF